MGEATSTNWPEGYLPLQGLFLVSVPNKCAPGGSECVDLGWKERQRALINQTILSCEERGPSHGFMLVIKEEEKFTKWQKVLAA